MKYGSQVLYIGNNVAFREIFYPYGDAQRDELLYFSSFGTQTYSINISGNKRYEYGALMFDVLNECMCVKYSNTRGISVYHEI